MYRHAKVGVIKTFTLLDRYKLPPLSVSVGGESLTAKLFLGKENLQVEAF
jgi:hypothetical protein